MEITLSLEWLTAIIVLIVVYHKRQQVGRAICIVCFCCFIFKKRKSWLIQFKSYKYRNQWNKPWITVSYLLWYEHFPQNFILEIVHMAPPKEQELWMSTSHKWENFCDKWLIYKYLNY